MNVLYINLNQKYEINSSSKEKKINNNNINTNLNTNVKLNERKHYIPTRREYKLVERNKTTTLNNAANTTNLNTTNVDDIIKEIRKKYGLDELSQKIGKYEEKADEKKEDKINKIN